MWQAFQSEFPILLYHVGLGLACQDALSPLHMDCLEMLLGREDPVRLAFSEYRMQSVGKDTYVDVKGLNLTQSGTYFVTVIGEADFQRI